MDQIRWPRSIGIAGQIPSDQVAKFIGIGTHALGHSSSAEKHPLPSDSGEVMSDRIIVDLVVLRQDLRQELL